MPQVNKVYCTLGERTQEMRIWKLGFDLDSYDNLRPKERWTLDKIKSFDGRGQYGSWYPVELERLEPEKGLGLSDAPGFYSHIPVFSENAVTILKKYIDYNAEILLTRFNEGNYYIINVTNVLECINWSDSKYKMFPDNKRVMRIEEYQFVEKKVKNQDFFKVKEETIKNAFVSDSFRETVICSGLTGFTFELVWQK